MTSIDKNSDNPFLTIKVNGVPVFCRGGNWGMDDGMERVSRERLEPFFKFHRQANFNMIRNWTGESTEEVFYDLCDEYGMLVWNDFWLSTEGHNLNVNDNNLFMSNATDVVKRFRNHASIVVWCPRNEGYAPAQIEGPLAELIANEDGTRIYQPNSRNLNLRPSGPWNFMTDPAEYYRKIAEGFSTEIGTPSVPTASTIRSFMPVEDQWPISDTWYYHDLHSGQKDYIKAIDARYGKSANLDDFCKKAQLVNYDSHRDIFESWNSKMWKKASGMLLWMSHPAWPSMVWQSYSWDYETFGSFFGAKKACEPVHIQMNLNDNKVVIINTTLRNYEQLSAKMELFDLKGKKIYNKNLMVNVQANRLTDCFMAELPTERPAIYLIRLTLSSGNTVLSQNDYWKSDQNNGSFEEFNHLANTRLNARIIKRQNGLATIMVTNDSKSPAISLKFNLRNPKSGKIILPVNISDGYFTLIPGEKKQIVAEWNSSLQKNPEVTVEGYNVKLQPLLTIQ
ncbi:MAG: glycoside hydrolase family 2 TIM barrel-domain containing protein [Bacteroidota bacterium]|nr:glycoside hydrolase family 2 TIM barrel-domain containing protein [Bacteroidota bacterium]